MMYNMIRKYRSRKVHGRNRENPIHVEGSHGKYDRHYGRRWHSCQLQRYTLTVK